MTEHATSSGAPPSPSAFNPQPGGPVWVVPMEIVRACCTATGTRRIVDLALRQAMFQPHALVRLTSEGFVAGLIYEEPAYPGREQHAAVKLMAVPQENGGAT